jgi:hypothetical protein
LIYEQMPVIAFLLFKKSPDLPLLSICHVPEFSVLHLPLPPNYVK